MSRPSFEIREIAIAVRDINAAARQWAAALGSEVEPTHTIEIPGVEVSGNGLWLDNDMRLAFATDATGSSPIGRFLDKRGEGLFELCIQTDDLEAAMAHMSAAGFEFVRKEPILIRDMPWKDKVHDVRIVFVHPRSAHGVQIELQEWSR